MMATLDWPHGTIAISAYRFSRYGVKWLT